MKLTAPQLELLKSLADAPHYVAPGYAPFSKLTSLGLAEDREGRYSTVAHITHAGRTVLANL